jgi:hypothetical protein
MASKIVQRLVAAGASPERARAFEKQFAASRPGLKPRELQDAFDEELGAISQAIWPNTFNPQRLSDAELNDYVIGVYGEQKYNDLTRRAAPIFNSALSSTNSVIKTIAEDARNGVAIGDTISTIRKLALQDTAKLGGLTEQDAISQANKIFNDYSKASAATKSFLKTDKYFKAGLPHPNLKYGEKTDFRAGTVDFKTNPTVEKVLTDPKQRERFITKRMAGVERARGLATTAGDALSRRELIGIEAQDPEKLFEQDVAKSFLESYGGSPFFDEVQRRESVKGKTLK